MSGGDSGRWVGVTVVGGWGWRLQVSGRELSGCDSGRELSGGEWVRGCN